MRAENWRKVGVSKQISFLLGSGFSAPDGMETVGQINAEIQKIKVEDIYIHTESISKYQLPLFVWTPLIIYIDLVRGSAN